MAPISSAVWAPATMRSPCSPEQAPGQPSVGQLADAAANILNTGTGTASGQDSITGIVLGDGYTGINYDFPQSLYPSDLISKRMLLNLDPGVSHTPGPSVVPEPSSIVLLALVLFVVGGVLLGGLGSCRWQ